MPQSTSPGQGPGSSFVSRESGL